MKILVQRYPSFDNATVGGLFVNGSLEMYTLEDQVREIPGVPVSQWKIPGETAIPQGTYNLVIDYSNRFKRLMPHILDVPGFDGIRLHIGNSAASTEGCILLGMTKTNSSVGQSKMAFNVFFPMLQSALNDGETVTIEIKNHESA